MKNVLITSAFLAAASLASVGAASAEEPIVEVVVPTDVSDAAAVEAYKAELNSAIREVCRKAASPIVGLGYYAMLDCIERTTKKIADEEPTGLLKASIEQPNTIVLADHSAG